MVPALDHAAGSVIANPLAPAAPLVHVLRHRYRPVRVEPTPVVIYKCFLAAKFGFHPRYLVEVIEFSVYLLDSLGHRPSYRVEIIRPTTCILPAFHHAAICIVANPLASAAPLVHVLRHRYRPVRVEPIPVTVKRNFLAAKLGLDARGLGKVIIFPTYLLDSLGHRPGRQIKIIASLIGAVPSFNHSTT